MSKPLTAAGIIETIGDAREIIRRHQTAITDAEHANLVFQQALDDLESIRQQHQDALAHAETCAARAHAVTEVMRVYGEAVQAIADAAEFLRIVESN